MAKQIWVKDLKPGMEFSETFLISDFSVGKTKRNSDYGSCKLTDKTGTITSKMWDYLPDKGSELLKNGAIVQVTGQVTEYQGKPDTKITHVDHSFDINPQDYEKTSRYSVHDMWGQFEKYLDNWDNQSFRIVTHDLFSQEDYKERFCISPAATGMHHAFKHGLLEHTLQMLQISERIVSLPFMGEVLNKDLCMFGIMFHDFGKIFEYSSDPGFNKTTQGILVGHIPMMGAKILEACTRLGVRDEIRDYMMHVVLAHHREMQWGSPVTPACPEASFVHFVDNMHADIFMMVQKTEESAAMIVNNFKEKYIKKQFNQVLEEISDEGISKVSGEEVVVGGL